MKNIIFKSLALLLLLNLNSPTWAFASPGKTVHIYYTGNGNGEVEPCGCSPKASYGGLKRRAQFFASIPESRRGIIIETGNFAPEPGEQGLMKLNLLLSSMKAMNYHIIAVKERERGFLPLLKSFSAEEGISLLSEEGGDFPYTTSANVSGVTFFVYNGIGALKARTLNRPGVHILLVNKPPSNIMGNLDFAGSIDLVINTGESYTSAEKNGSLYASINKRDGQTIGHITLKFDEKENLAGFSEEQILLTPEISDAPAITSLFDTYNREVADFFKKKSQEKKLTKGIFLGDKNCKTCHEPFWKSWSETRHAGAWDTLVNRGKTSDPDCVPCHSVGYGKEGGFISEEKTPDLKNVQCETCHGPGVLHSSNFSKRLNPVNEGICRTCHNEKHSPDFDYKEYFRKIIH